VDRVKPDRCPFRDGRGNQCARPASHDPSRIAHLVLLVGGEIHLFRIPKNAELSVQQDVVP
jgi:hypothetical protein